MTYRVAIAPLARRQIRKLPREVQKRVIKLIEKLASDPRPGGVKKLLGEKNLYRVRSGEYRVIFQIHDREFVVLVLKAAHRREAYP